MTGYTWLGLAGLAIFVGSFVALTRIDYRDSRFDVALSASAKAGLFTCALAIVLGMVEALK